MVQTGSITRQLAGIDGEADGRNQVIEFLLEESATSATLCVQAQHCLVDVFTGAGGRRSPEVCNRTSDRRP